jgi:DNA-binding MarR family transcriptional regulator
MSDGMLSEEEITVWTASYRASQRLIDQLDRDLQRHSSVSLAEFLVLHELFTNADGVRMTQLAEAANLSKSRLSHCVDRLVGLGWVERVRVPGDKRGLLARLRAEGVEKFREAAPRHTVDVRRYFVDAVPLAEYSHALTIADAVNGALDANPVS